MHPTSQLCERAKSWASLRTDGELSELESALLDAHLGRCPSCSTFAQGAEHVAAALREARIERPAPLVLRPHHTRRTGLRALQVAAAVAVVVTAGVVAAVS
ncbi:MAG TPA: zf-HC2 domain-containing protein, partial [Gaiellaceae bacterium]